MTIAEECRQKAAIELAEAAADGRMEVRQIVAYREARDAVRAENEARNDDRRD